MAQGPRKVHTPECASAPGNLRKRIAEIGDWHTTYSKRRVLKSPTTLLADLDRLSDLLAQIHIEAHGNTGDVLTIAIDFDLVGNTEGGLA